MALVSFKRGTKPSNVQNLDSNTIYFFTDSKEIYLGSELYGADPAGILESIDGIEGDITEIQQTLEELADLPDDVTTLQGQYAELQAALAKKLDSIAAADNSVTVGGTETAKTIKVNISEDEDNVLELKTDGLYVNVEGLPETALTDYTVTVTEQGTAETGYAKTYVIAQPGTELSAKINIPKDLVVSKGEMVTNDGSSEGTFIKLTLNNDDVIYIDVADLVDQVEANNGDGIVTVTVTDGYKIGASIAKKAVTAEYLDDDVNEDIEKGTDAYDALTWGTL